MNLSLVSRYLTKAPTTLQIAKDGKWEESWIIPTMQGLPSLQEVKSYLEKEPFQTLELELIFQESKGTYIFGIDHSSRLLTSKPTDFLKVIFQLITKYRDFKNFIKAMDSDLIGSQYLLRQEPDVIRIGVVNHWFTIGPCQIWEKGKEKRMTENKLKMLLSKNPKVISTQLNYQGLSFVSGLNDSLSGVCHWIKSPCSYVKDGIWTLDTDMILNYLNEWEGFEIQ